MFGFLKRGKGGTQLPSKEAEPERYKGRPLLIVLEQYVLSCIGEGSAETDARMLAIVQRVWGGGEDWQKTVRDTLQLEAGIDDAIRDLWSKNQQIARQANTDLHPVQFAKMFVDTNFVPLIENTD